MLINNIRVDQPMYQAVQFPPGSGPGIPMIDNVPAFLQQYLLDIGGQVVNTVTSGVMSNGVHAGRIMLYNQLYANNFQNAEFALSVSQVVDYLLLALHRKEISEQYVQQGFPTAITRALGLMNAWNISRTPQLASIIPPPIVTEATNLAAAAPQLLQVVNSMKAYYNNPNATMQPHMGGYQPPYPQHQPQAIMQTGSGMGYATASSRNNFGATFSMPGNQGSAPVADAGRYGHLVESAKQFVQPQQQQAFVQPVQQAQPVAPVAPPVALLKNWSPSSLQAYVHAYYADTEEAVASWAMNPVDQTQCILVNIQPKPAGESEMDRTKHQIQHGYHGQNPDSNPARGAELAGKSGAILAAEKEKLLPTVLYEEPLRTHSMASVVSLDDAVLKSQHALMKANNGNIRGKAMTVSYLSAKPIVTRGSFRGTLEDLANCKNFAELATRLSGITAKTTNDSEQHVLFEQLDGYVTREFNLFLKDKLSVGHVRLSSFAEDGAEIITYLHNEQGSIYADALRDQQVSFIKKTFSQPEAELYDKIIYTLIDANHSEAPVGESKELVSPYTTSVFQFITVTAVGFHARHLNVGLIKNHAGVLTEERFPGLHTYAKAILKSANNDDLPPVAHHYIVTSDSHVYEIHQGLIGVNTYLISHVRPLPVEDEK